MDFHHQYSIQVRWGDMDAYGHVNNAMFFKYLESARFAYIEDLLMPVLGGDIPVIVLADIQCRFEQQIVYPATVVVKTKVVRLGNSSFDVVAEMWQEARRVASSKAVLVWVDPNTYRPMKIPEAAAAQIQLLEGL